MAFRRTINHEEIRSWVQEHGGQPRALRTTDGDFAIVRFDYRDALQSSASSVPLEPISWDEFFHQFEDRRLAFVYEENAESGQENKLSKLVGRQGS